MEKFRGNIFVGDGFQAGEITVEAGIMTNIEVYGDGCKASDDCFIPGLVELHTHGCMNHDFSDGDADAMKTMTKFYASHGVTSICPTTMTLPYETLSRAFGVIRDYAREEWNPNGQPREFVGARIAGINMEGPYFSEKKKGAQNSDYLKKPDIEGFKKLYDECDGMINLVDVAPELEGAVEFIREASKLCTVSVAHTDANYEEAVAAFEAGADHLTHLYNAMPPIHHRNPGVIGAASENEKVWAELICDGQHIHPSAVRMAFKLFENRICLVSDSLRCAGMPDGEYELGGQQVFLKGGIARLASGTIAGSSANLYDCMKKAIEFGIPRHVAINAASINPARSIGAQHAIGSIGRGKFADFIICDWNLDRKAVFIGGKEVG